MIFTPDEIHDRIKQAPFQPLRFVTSSGNSYDVYHPDLVMVGTQFVIVGLPATNKPSIFEKNTRIAIAHITELQDLDPPLAPAGMTSGADSDHG